VQCEGYPSRSTSTDTQASGQSGLQLFNGDLTSPPTAPQPRLALSSGFRKQPEQQRLAHLACSILTQGTYRDLGAFTSIWDRLLPQLNHAIPSVNAAAAALGAIYESTLLPSSTVSKQSASLHYGIAIRHVQQDVISQLHGPVPLLLSCALLSFVEILRGRQYNALMHLQAALALVRSREDDLIKARDPKVMGVSGFDAFGASTAGVEDNLSLMFMTLDIQKASYVLGQPPDLSVSCLQNLPPVSSGVPNINETELHLVRLIHSCYHFTAHASQFKYLSRALIPAELIQEQSRHIVMLSLWLDNINRDFLPDHPDSRQKLSPDAHCHALVLRSQCLSTLVYLSTVLSAQESSYDVHALRFQRIIRDAATVLTRASGVSSQLPHIRPCPGIIQPLFFTTMKYRHENWRQQAIGLLRRAGREGPFDGNVLAAAASRLAEIEESPPRPLNVGDVLPEHVPEADRVHGCGMDAEAKDDDEPARSITVMFSRCRNVEGMLSGTESWDHGSNWNIWDEVLEL
jgi:Fungal specific transcription factor domain